VTKVEAIANVVIDQGYQDPILLIETVIRTLLCEGIPKGFQLFRMGHENPVKIPTLISEKA